MALITLDNGDSFSLASAVSFDVHEPSDTLTVALEQGHTVHDKASRNMSVVVLLKEARILYASSAPFGVCFQRQGLRDLYVRAERDFYRKHPIGG